jgi:hypothetical protein
MQTKCRKNGTARGIMELVELKPEYKCNLFCSKETKKNSREVGLAMPCISTHHSKAPIPCLSFSAADPWQISS